MNEILLGKCDEEIYLHARYANRHGIAAGATRDGKKRVGGQLGRSILRRMLGSILKK